VNRKALALLEVTAAKVVVKFAMVSTVPLLARRFGPLLGNAFDGMLLIVPTLLLILLPGRRLADYGLNLSFNWRSAVHFGFWALVVKMAAEGPGFALWHALGTPGFFIALLLVGLSIWLMLWMFRKEPPTPRIDWKIAIMVVLLVLPGGVAAIAHKDLARILRLQLYFLVWIGFAEELFHRGYMQSRLNEAWGRPWKIWGTQFGPGLIFASILFGLPHMYQGDLSQINVLMGIGACFGGLFFGIIREKTGSITGGVIAHGIATAGGEIYGFLG
jgi:membrane protease YdiL (CAAX protease family)